MKETNVQNLSLIAASSDPDVMLWRNQSGVFKTMDGSRTVRVGMPGTPDSLGVCRVLITPEMVGTYIGVAFGIEFKTLKKGSKQRDDQINWQQNFERRSGVYKIIRDPLDVKKFIEDIKKGETG